MPSPNNWPRKVWPAIRVSSEELFSPPKPRLTCPQRKKAVCHDSTSSYHGLVCLQSACMSHRQLQTPSEQAEMNRLFLLTPPTSVPFFSRGSINNLLNGWVKWKCIHWQNVPTWTFCDFSSSQLLKRHLSQLVAGNEVLSWQKAPTYTYSLGEAWGFKQIQNLLLRWATGCGIQRKPGWLGVVATPGHRCTVHRLNTGPRRPEQSTGLREENRELQAQNLGPNGLQN